MGENGRKITVSVSDANTCDLYYSDKQQAAVCGVDRLLSPSEAWRDHLHGDRKGPWFVQMSNR